MGNFKFRLSDMMPNAWFYKLKDMSTHKGNKSHNMPHSTRRSHNHSSRTSTPATPKHFQTPQTRIQPNRASYYFSSRTESERFFSSPINPKASDTQFPVDSPRKSKKKNRTKSINTKLVSSSVSAGCSCRVWKTEATIPEIPASQSPASPPYQYDYYIDGKEDDEFQKTDLSSQFDSVNIPSWSRSCSCRVTSSATDIIIDMRTKSSISKNLDKIEDFNAVPKLEDFDTVSELELRPILTKPLKKEAEQVKFDDKKVDENVESYRIVSPVNEHSKSEARRPPPGPHRLRIRANSPRLASKKVQVPRARRSSLSMRTASTQQRKGLSDSFAVMKSSSNPQKDFRESMLEMIVENNIRASKDLEELLACYLSLNSNEYHDVIVKVFEQIWFDLTNIKL